MVWYKLELKITYLESTYVSIWHISYDQIITKYSINCSIHLKEGTCMLNQHCWFSPSRARLALITILWNPGLFEEVRTKLMAGGVLDWVLCAKIKNLVSRYVRLWRFKIETISKWKFKNEKKRRRKRRNLSGQNWGQPWSNILFQKKSLVKFKQFHVRRSLNRLVGHGFLIGSMRLS